MNGIQDYNNHWYQKTIKLINNSKYSDILEKFYMNILSSKAYSSAHSYITYVNSFLNYINIEKVETISMMNYDSYLVSIKGKTASYQIVVYSALKAFSKFLSANDICKDYMQYKDRPKFTETQSTKNKRNIGYMTTNEISDVNYNLYESNEHYQRSDCWLTRDAAIIYILLSSGIRSAALYKLDIDDVNFDDSCISVMEKGLNARKIVLSEKTMRVIKEWMLYRDELVGNDERALFISKHRNRMSQSSIALVVKNKTKIIKNKNITPHKIRSTYGTQLYELTHDIYFVQKCMGHSSPKTSELYIRGQKDNISKKAADLMDSIID